MRKLWLIPIAWLLVSPAVAQNVVGPSPFAAAGAYNTSPPTCTNNNFCYFQTDANGVLKVSASFTPSGTQNVNLTQILGAAPSLTNPLWVFPATGATFPVSLPTTPTVAAGSGTVPSPSAEALAGLSTGATTILASNLVAKNSAGNLYSFNVSADSTLSGAAWWIMIFNSTTLPGDGTVTPAKCYAMSSGTTSYSAAFPTPVAFTTGIVIGVSTTGCFTKTASVHSFISGDFK